MSMIMIMSIEQVTNQFLDHGHLVGPESGYLGSELYGLPGAVHRLAAVIYEQGDRLVRDLGDVHLETNLRGFSRTGGALQKQEEADDDLHLIQFAGNAGLKGGQLLGLTTQHVGLGGTKAMGLSRWLVRMMRNENVFEISGRWGRC